LKDCYSIIWQKIIYADQNGQTQSINPVPFENATGTTDSRFKIEKISHN
jgi:hypothetical protein